MSKYVHFNISKMRIDTWHKLKYACSNLANLSSRNKEWYDNKEVLAECLNILRPLEQYWGYPGKERFQELLEHYKNEDYSLFAQTTNHVVHMMVSDNYRNPNVADDLRLSKNNISDTNYYLSSSGRDKSSLVHYFVVLYVDNLSPHEERQLRQKMKSLRSPEDKFVYEIVVVPSYEDAIIAALINYNIQSCIIRYGFPYKSSTASGFLKPQIPDSRKVSRDSFDSNLGATLGEQISSIRPELDLFLVTDSTVEDIASSATLNFKRIFYHEEDSLELHLSIMKSIQERYKTPFFDALKEYSKIPTGVFHAMPISRGNSVFKSHWIQDMAEFYGTNMFLAETSATTGGLDSLLHPTGPLKKAQEMASKTFGADRTFFVTNGTSTANKIVLQALIRPGDVVLIDRECHKSHHYGMVLSGSYPVYLDSYPIEKYSMYGAVPLKVIKKTLLHFKKKGRLDQVRMVLLTNCTFDGIVYNVKRFMTEILAIKPDMIFLWDEAWFSFARFEPTYSQRTAMRSAEDLYNYFQSEDYKKEYQDFIKNINLDSLSDEDFINTPLLPDPTKIKMRVYSTQSTHKTLSCLRQGSMIHVHDQDFKSKVEDSFHEAYMTHTSTSPNYQILASLDLARRQADFEGLEFVQLSVECAMTIREKVTTHPLIKKYFSILSTKDIIPEEYRESKIEVYFSEENGWEDMSQAWKGDEFVLDPTRITLFVGDAGIDGDTFKNKYLMNLFGVQINKTSINTALFMTNIGTTRSSVAYLIEVLIKIAKQLETEEKEMNPSEKKLRDKKINKLTKEQPPLPDFSSFHPEFQYEQNSLEGDIRKAYFKGYNEEMCEYVTIDEADEILNEGKYVVSATFITPYPPGFPILVPGQTVSHGILEFMKKLDVSEIHGYREDLGLKVFKDSSLTELNTSQDKTKITKKKAAKC